MNATKENILEVIQDIIKNASDDERFGLTMDILFEAALWGGYNHAESIGMLECVKYNLQRSFEDCEICDECKAKEKNLPKLN
jgi:hypothetical protein